MFQKYVVTLQMLQNIEKNVSNTLIFIGNMRYNIGHIRETDANRAAGRSK